MVVPKERYKLIYAKKIKLEFIKICPISTRDGILMAQYFACTEYNSKLSTIQNDQ